MNDERFDFSRLDLGNDPERFEKLVGTITWRARAELARRGARREVSAVEAVAVWYRPAMAAAAAIAAVSLTLLSTVGRSNNETTTGAYMSSAEVPAALSSWYEDGTSPTADDLIVVANNGGK